ncbi:PD-(D/E)XK nuclease family protein [Dysgonomonas sp. 520]|uniref:PD-(D/E)XK nuclease family protein n=1 Tax=Dysgonomonas sp. 520 TaxID=2302931 RepID=UPI0013D30316|nr:PD-(D/E)XK nuclease family protein [Dysgonomonas sp. 520]NDW10001.1 PD-(D/E)XK nuclease family protein [Dysgonomonas sp. 520]
MTPFLFNVAKTYYKHHGKDISKFTFVFPNRRTGLFFQKYLSQLSKQPIFSPQILTVADLFAMLTEYRITDRIELLFTLYDNYKKISSSSESFDEFVFWGEMLLNDFDDVDKYMVDAQQLFRNVYDLKEIDAGFSFLTEDQIMAIRRFWSSFLPIGDSEKKKDFMEMWQILFQLYTSLRNDLIEKGLAYEGMIFRDVAQRAKDKEVMDLPFEKIIFVGLNAHSKSEEELLKYLKNTGIADFYWDYSSPMVKDAYNKSSFFIDKNRVQFPSQYQLDAEKLFMENPTIEVVGIPSSVGQAKYVHTILQTLVDENHIQSADNALNTAVVLPDENLLLPTLYSIPKSIEKINVTMGYNLHHSSVAGLMEQIFDLQKNIRFSDEGIGFYFRFVLPILNHRYLMAFLPSEVQHLKQEIIKYNKHVVPTKLFAIHPLLELIFTPIDDCKDVSGYLQKILSQINKFTYSKRKEAAEDTDASQLDIESEFIIEYYKTINKMDESLKKVSVTEMSVDTYFRLLRKLIAGISVPFSGEPLSGLQVMGVLETRALDFENLIILSMNEGIFPLKKATNSFIPYNLRHGFGLPTYEHQDSVYAYHFYRMISRARRIYLLYDTRTEGLQTGEISRYFYQLKHLYSDRFDIRERLAVYEVSANASLSISMKKTEEVQEKLNSFLHGGDRSLSASSINMYLDCPLQFYFSVVEQLKEDEEVTETIEASTFGSIFHEVMEWLYEPLKGKLVTADLLKNISKDDKLLTHTIERSFAKNYFKNPDDIRRLTGQNYLTGEVMRRYVRQVLKTDIKLTPFIYIESERRIETEYPLPSGKMVALKGFLDRIDEVKGHTRIIDYKTGKGELRFSNMNQVFDKAEKDRPKAVMQVLMYAHLYQNEFPERIIEPGIYFLRNLFDTGFDADVIHKPGRTGSIRMTDFSVYREEFKTQFDACLEEIFDPAVPFTQTPTGKACEWCSFTNICKK